MVVVLVVILVIMMMFVAVVVVAVVTITISIIFTTSIHNISDIFITILCFVAIVSNNRRSQKSHLHKNRPLPN